MANLTPEAERALMKRWVDQWKITGPELERIKKEELRAMTEEEAFATARRLSRYEGDVWITQDRRDSIGLIEQQRLFGKGHRAAR
ncbi:hypothetical protein BH20VER1_BH20VER1_10790 [soil metagenome]